MAEKKPVIKLWSIRSGKLQNFEVSIENSEVVATNPETDEVIKFPGGITVGELTELAIKHNEANQGVTGISPEDIKAQEDLDAANSKLLEDLK